MFLKSLALRGFKTFADTTEIEFGGGARITAVVGPNGCGKSNILDAVRWVLGEDNPRNLRVAALSDIIFAGTDRRKPLSLAEVTLLFDNSAGKLPVPFTEVSIRRRAFREGESEFFTNKTPCRLKDIKDLLLDTGLGEGTYSIITQGQVDALLSSKGEDQRAVFEEAAGINKYRVRKQSAEKKLIAAEQNILRVSDLKVEVGEHLQNLEEQARRAQEYLQIQAQVKETEIGLYKKLAGSLLEKKVKLEEALAQARQTAAEDETRLDEVKEKLRRIEIEIEEEAVRLDAEKDRRRDLELNRRFLEGEAAREEKQIAELSRRLEEINRHEPRAAAAVPLLSEVVEQAKELFNRLNALIVFWGGRPAFSFAGEKDEAHRLKVELIEQELERARFGLQAHRAELENLAAPPAGDLGGGLSKLKQERDNLRARLAELEAKRGRGAGGSAVDLEIALAKLEGEMIGLTEKLSGEYNLGLADLSTLPHQVSNISKARAEVEEGKFKLRSLEPVNLLAIDEFEKTKERLSFLETQLADLNGARENLRNLICELDLRAIETFTQMMQQLSTVFSETFSKLFAGGEAKISLSPGKPVLEAEIEISVRPAGRRWLSLSLLSGGERSLSAIAILFSLLKIHPSPFCFLDEVDAALDEANIGRFAEMLQDFSAATQIIVITHNKRTMAAADNIYGVTMEEAGVSKVISMQLQTVNA